MRLWRHPCKPPNRIRYRKVDAETEDEVDCRHRRAGAVRRSQQRQRSRTKDDHQGAGVTDYSSRARITVSGKCFGLIISLLKFSEKISEPVGHGRLKDVVFPEASSDSVLNMA
jgi:hypothetical protein